MSRPDDLSDRERSDSASHSRENDAQHHLHHEYGGGSRSSTGPSGEHGSSRSRSDSGSSSHRSEHSSRSSSGSHSGERSSRSGSGSRSGERSSRSSSGSHSGQRSSRSSSGSRSSEHSSSSTSQQDEQRRSELMQKYQVVTDEQIEREKMHGHHHHRHHHSRRRKVRRTLIAVASIPLALILILASVVGILSLIGRSQVREETSGIKTNPYSVSYDEGKTVEYDGVTYALNEDIVTIAAIGIDRTQFGLLDDKIGTAGQADMILIAALDMRSGLVRSLMVPRDTMVDVDRFAVSGEYVGVDRMQICLSFAYGDGRETSSKNVLTSVGRVLYGIPVSLYGVMDLDGIAALNDAIGGVAVTLQEPFEGNYAGDRILLRGMQAHDFVRSRDTSILESDTYRRARQVQYLRAFTDKAVSAASKDIGVIRNLYDVAMKYAFTNVSLSRVMYLATTLLTKGVEIADPVVLAGKMQEGDPYAEYILDEQAVFESVLEIFYTPVASSGAAEG